MQIVNLTPATVEGMRSLWRGLRVLGQVVLLLSAARTQSPTADEYQVKTAFLYNFAKFVESPLGSFSDASAPLRICVLGRDPFGELRNLTKEKIVSGRKLEVNHAVDLQPSRSCHILFITSSGKTPMKTILEGLRGANVLTVGDSKGFVQQGGMINFVVENDQVQFEVNPKAAEPASLKISSRLLSVAKLVLP